jgi:hypothetical protein
MIIYEPITMLEPTIPMIGKRCISKAEKHYLGIITVANQNNTVRSSKMSWVGFMGYGYYNWLAIFGYPKDYSIQSLIAVVANMATAKCLIVDYGPRNDQIVEIL